MDGGRGLALGEAVETTDLGLICTCIGWVGKDEEVVRLLSESGRVPGGND